MTDRTDPNVTAWLDQEHSHTAQLIREHGVYIQYVLGDSERRSTPFAYTVGLFGVGHPELLVFGVGTGTASALLNTVSDWIRGGRDLVPGEILEFDEWTHRVVVESVPNPGQIVFAANAFYSRPDEFSVEVYQLTTDDKAGRFPWEEAYDVPAWVQPRPGEFSALG